MVYLAGQRGGPWRYSYRATPFDCKLGFYRKLEPMGKKRRQQKLERKTTVRPRLTWRELLKVMPGVFLRSFVVVFGLAALMVILSSFGLAIFKQPLVQMAVYLAGILGFNRFINGPLRRGLPPKK